MICILPFSFLFYYPQSKCSFLKEPGDEDFEPTIKKISDASGHLQITDTSGFSKSVLDSKDGETRIHPQKSCEINLFTVTISVQWQELTSYCIGQGLILDRYYLCLEFGCRTFSMKKFSVIPPYLKTTNTPNSTSTQKQLLYFSSVL